MLWQERAGAGGGYRPVTFYGLRLRLCARASAPLPPPVPPLSQSPSPPAQQAPPAPHELSSPGPHSHPHPRAPPQQQQLPPPHPHGPPPQSSTAHLTAQPPSAAPSPPPVLALALGLEVRCRAHTEAVTEELRSALAAAKGELDARRSRLLAEQRANHPRLAARRRGGFGHEGDDAGHGHDLETASGGGGGGGGGDPGGRCVICLDRTARVAFAPCAHVCCCEVCGQDPAVERCPVCRRSIARRIGLYFS